MNVAKYHHINPQFVLRHFATKDQWLRVIRLSGRTGYSSLVENTGGENHLYSIPKHPSGPDVFEKRLGAGIEGETAAIFERVIGGEWPLPMPERDTLAEFVALQMLRGPERRRQMESAAGEIFSKAAGQLGKEGFARWVSDTAEKVLSEDEIEDLWSAVTSSKGLTIPQSARDHIEMMGEATEEVAGFLGYRPWTLVRFTGRSLITCDAPVSLVAHHRPGPWMGVSVRNARLVVYPMTRDMGLVMRNPLDDRYFTGDVDAFRKMRSGAFDETSAGTALEERLMNECTAANAVSNIYHHPDDAQFVPSKYREKNA